MCGVGYTQKNTCLLLHLLFLFTINICLGEGFIEGTLVKTPHGYTAIESLKPGDKVFCEDHNFVLCEKPILTVVRKKVPSYFRVSLKDQRNNAQITIFTADDQKLCTHHANKRRWAHVKDLSCNDVLPVDRARFMQIENTERIAQETTLYTLIINDHHNFFVTHHDIRAHNFALELLSVSVLFGAGACEFLWFGGAASIFGIVVYFAKQIFDEGIRKLWFHLSSSHYEYLANKVDYSELETHQSWENQWISRSTLLSEKQPVSNKKKKSKRKTQHNNNGNNNGGNINKPDKDPKKPDPKLPIAGLTAVAKEKLRKMMERNKKGINKYPQANTATIAQSDATIQKTFQRLRHTEDKAFCAQFQKSGWRCGMRKDFEKMNLADISVKPNGTTVGYLPDGRAVNMRTKSDSGYPTLEVQSPNHKFSLKIRYY